MAEAGLAVEPFGGFSSILPELADNLRRADCVPQVQSARQDRLRTYHRLLVEVAYRFANRSHNFERESKLRSKGKCNR
jgi:hypothetical protein